MDQPTIEDWDDVELSTWPPNGSLIITKRGIPSHCVCGMNGLRERTPREARKMDGGTLQGRSARNR